MSLYKLNKPLYIFLVIASVHREELGVCFNCGTKQREDTAEAIMGPSTAPSEPSHNPFNAGRRARNKPVYAC